MIPEPIARFLEGATVACGTTRDAALVPQVHRLAAWTVAEDRESIVCLFASDAGEDLIPRLEENGQFAITMLGSNNGPRRSDPPNPSLDFHECYQFKGEYVASRAATEDDRALVRRQAKLFKDLFQPIFGFTDAGCAARFGKPVLAVTIRVREIYDQTPGPDAGGRIYPEGAP